MRRAALLISFIPMVLIGCAYSSQDVKINPILNVAVSTIGQGKDVEVKVADEREDKDLGRRTEVNNMGAMITNTQDLEEVFMGKIQGGLESKGFKVTKTGQPSRMLKIEIRSIKYTTSMGIVRGGFLANASVKAIAKNGNETYEKMYRASEDEKGFFLPFADENERQINAAVSGAINEIFKDQQLIEFLAK